MNTKLLTSTMLLLSVTLVAGNVSAAILSSNTLISLNDNVILVPADVGSLYGFNEVALSGIQQFDGSLGTLNSVTIFIQGDISYSTTVEAIDVLDNEASNSIDIGYNVGVGAAVPIGSAIHLRAYEQVFDTLGCFEDAYMGPCSEGGGGSALLNPSDVFTGSDLAAFLGTGSLENISIGLLGGLDSLFADNVSDSVIYIDFSFNGTATVEYEYSAVPVPAAMWLFGSGLLGLIGVARRKKA